MALTPPVGTVRLDTTLEGTIQFVPTAPLLRIDNDGDWIVIPDQIHDFVLDGTATQTLDLTATDDPTVAPFPRQWRARFFTAGPSIDDVVFGLPAGTVQDLSDLVDIAVVPGIVKVVTDEDRRAAEAAAVAARAAQAAAEEAAASIGGGGVPTGREYAFENSSLWSIPHTLSRRPAVILFDENGNVIDTDVSVSPTLVTATFPDPVTGTAVLT